MKTAHVKLKITSRCKVNGIYLIWKVLYNALTYALTKLQLAVLSTRESLTMPMILQHIFNSITTSSICHIYPHLSLWQWDSVCFRKITHYLFVWNVLNHLFLFIANTTFSGARGQKPTMGLRHFIICNCVTRKLLKTDTQFVSARKCYQGSYSKGAMALFRQALILLRAAFNVPVCTKSQYHSRLHVTLG